MAARRVLVRGLAALALLLLAFAVGAAAWWLRRPPNLVAWQSGPPPAPWASWQRQEAAWRADGNRRQLEHVYVPLGDIAEELVVAVLVSEDIGFFGHVGLDPRAIGEAVDEWRRGGRLRGASTISQQLARILFLSPERSLERKLEEARLAWWCERVLGKRRILELYLNTIEFGPGVFGAEAAASHYYGVEARQLGLEQSAGLAAAIPAPGRDNPATASARWSSRRKVIETRAARATWLRVQVRGSLRS